MKKLNEVLASSRILSFNEMKKVTGGVTAQKYCKTLRTIIMNNELDEGERNGANAGWIAADCGRFYKDILL